MIKFTINGKPTNIPSSWADISYQQYFDLLSVKTFTERIVILTKIPAESIANAQIIGLEKLLQAISFADTPEVFQPTGKLGQYKVPADITIESLGQFEDLIDLSRQIPKKDVANYTLEDTQLLIDIHLKACAIFYQKLKTGNYSSATIDEVMDELKHLPVADIIGNGAFFLIKPHLMLQNTKTTSQKITPPQKKKRRVSRGSAKRSGSSRR